MKFSNHIDLFVELVKTGFKMRYQNSILGVLWVLIKPYTIFIVMYFIWSQVINQDIPNYPVYLLLGVIIYAFINELVILGQLSLLDRAGVILKVNFPRQIAVISSLTSAIINLLINLPFALIIIIITGQSINFLGIIYLFVVASVIFTWGVGLSFFTSIITIRFRDLKNIADLGMFLLYWATPILYAINQTPENTLSQKIILANPIGILLNQVRAGFGVYGEINLGLMAIYFIVGIVFSLLGWIYFSRHVKKIAEFF
jgi:ABC-2 type transport system permease protein